MSIKTFAFSLLALATGATAQATVVLDNVSNNGSSAITTGNSVGQSFLTGTAALSVGKILFPQIGGSAPVQQPDGSVTGGYTNNFVSGETYTLYGNLPGLNSPDLAFSLGSFSLSQSTNDDGTPIAAGGLGFAQTLALPTSPITLDATTRYWLVLSTGDAATASWSGIDAAQFGYNESSALGVTVAPGNHTAYKTVGTGVTAATTYYNYSQGPQQLYIVADAVPEPSSLGLLVIAGAGAFLVVRRVRSVKAA